MVSVIATFGGTVVLAAVDPVPWARAQMAFTLMFHIILVPLGVSWAFMTLIANYRAVKHGDRDALVLAQRWSKYMAVTFAVGAVTGTVLSFEFGLLWPRFMGQWGAAFGVPFAFEGVFFFTEAIFVAIYIFGWRRLKPWAHFWTGVPDRARRDPRQRLGGRGQRVDERAVGVHADCRRQRRHGRPAAGDLQQGDAAAGGAHGRGRLSRRRASSSPRCTPRACCAGAPTATTGSGSSSRSRVAAVATPIQMGVGDSLARWVYTNQPVKFAAIELVPTTSSDVPETLLGRLNDDGTVSGGIPIPGLASWLSDPSTGRSTVVQGLDTVPADDRPTVRQVNIVHLALGRHGGPGNAAVPVVGVVRRQLGVPAPDAGEQVVPPGGSRLGCPDRHLHGGRLDRDRGRSPAVDRLRAHEGRGRGHGQHRGLDHVLRGRRCCTSWWASPRSSSCAQ